MSNSIVVDLATSLLTQMGADQLPDDAREQLQKNIEAGITERLGLIIAKHLSEEGLHAYATLLENSSLPSTTEMQSFLEQYLPNYETVIQEEMDAFIREIADGLQSGGSL